MKTKTKKQAPDVISQPSAKFTVTTCMSAKEANADFMKRMSTEKYKNHIKNFLFIIDGIRATTRSFQEQDVYTRANPFDIPHDILRDLTKRWLEVQLSINRIQEVSAVYDSPQYFFLY